MILAWDHIATRYLDRIRHHREATGRIESIRLLAIHDAVHAVFGSGGGFIFKRSSADDSLDAALAAAARASYGILASVFREAPDQAALSHSLEESLSLVAGTGGRDAGSAIGTQSASSYLATFAPFVDQVREVVASASGPVPFGRRPPPGNRFVRDTRNGSPLIGWRRSA